MNDKEEILAAIGNLGTDLRATIDKNHAQVMGLLDTIALGTGRIEAELGTVKSDVGRIETKLDRHETRIESLEARP